MLLEGVVDREELFFPGFVHLSQAQALPTQLLVANALRQGKLVGRHLDIHRRQPSREKKKGERREIELVVSQARP